MIESNMDMLAGLSALIGVNAPVPAGEGNDFAGLFETIKIKSAVQSDLSGLETLPVTPVVPEQVIHAQASPDDEAAMIPETVTPLKIARLDKSQKREIPTGKDGIVAPAAASQPMGETAANPAISKQPKSDATIASPDAILGVAGMPAITIEASPEVANLASLHPNAKEISPQPAAPAPAKSHAVERPVETLAPSSTDPRITIVASAHFEPAKPTSRTSNEKPEVIIATTGEVRSAPLISIIEKLAVSLPERAPTFAPLIADAARDLVNLTQDKNVRFNVRPEVLGSIAVTIERSDAGQTLRLGVETHSAAQVVRQAEPMMNDARGTAPFVQVTVDLNAPDQRGRSARAPTIQKPHDERNSDAIEQRTTLAATGRYA